MCKLSTLVFLFCGNIITVQNSSSYFIYYFETVATAAEYTSRAILASSLSSSEALDPRTRLASSAAFLAAFSHGK